jgi:hypothetical protein
MSRKHYRETAGILRHAYQRVTTLGQETVINEIADGLAGMFKRDNLNFDRQRFIDAIFEEQG